MDQKWIQILVILVFYPKITSGAALTVNQGEEVPINCEIPEGQGMVTWFRVLDKSGTEFIVSFSNGQLKAKSPVYERFRMTVEAGKVKKLVLKSFNKDTDSGMYSCACIKSNEMKFGPMTRLVGDVRTVTVPAPQAPTARPGLFTTPRACNCNSSTGVKIGVPVFFCPLIILGPLVGACGFLLVLLIITILYCNKMRTRRCPHHHRRKPRTKDREKYMTN